MADTRKYDIDQIMKARASAKNGFERDIADKALYAIMRENGMVREKREQLVMAVRNNDHRAIQRFQQELMMMKANRTYGKDY